MNVLKIDLASCGGLQDNCEPGVKIYKKGGYWDIGPKKRGIKCRK